jgi:hypothetical protein
MGSELNSVGLGQLSSINHVNQFQIDNSDSSPSLSINHSVLQTRNPKSDPEKIFQSIVTDCKSAINQIDRQTQSLKGSQESEAKGQPNALFEKLISTADVSGKYVAPVISLTSGTISNAPEFLRKELFMGSMYLMQGGLSVFSLLANGAKIGSNIHQFIKLTQQINKLTKEFKAQPTNDKFMEKIDFLNQQKEEIRKQAKANIISAANSAISSFAGTIKGVAKFTGKIAVHGTNIVPIIGLAANAATVGFNAHKLIKASQALSKAEDEIIALENQADLLNSSAIRGSNTEDGNTGQALVENSLPSAYYIQKLYNLRIKALNKQKKDLFVEKVRSGLSFASSIVGLGSASLYLATAAGIAVSATGIGALALAGISFGIGIGYLIYKNRRKIQARFNQVKQYAYNTQSKTSLQASFLAEKTLLKLDYQLRKNTIILRSILRQVPIGKSQMFATELKILQRDYRQKEKDLRGVIQERLESLNQRKAYTNKIPEGLVEKQQSHNRYAHQKEDLEQFSTSFISFLRKEQDKTNSSEEVHREPRLFDIVVQLGLDPITLTSEQLFSYIRSAPKKYDFMSLGAV